MVDEYGALQGLITLGDILEEIFGDIPDEYAKVESSGIRALADGSYLIDGTLPIRELNRELDWDLPDEEATTIAGLVIHEARTIPDVGQRFAFHGIHFEILRRHRNQITAMRIIRHHARPRRKRHISAPGLGAAPFRRAPARA